jgi:hypothetical protein
MRSRQPISPIPDLSVGTRKRAYGARHVLGQWYGTKLRGRDRRRRDVRSVTCDLAKRLHDADERLAIHVISFRYQTYSWTGEQSVLEAKCLAEQSGGLYITVDTEQDLVAALEKTLDCPMISWR